LGRGGEELPGGGKLTSAASLLAANFRFMADFRPARERRVFISAANKKPATLEALPAALAACAA
jgi:hypothetical protein